MAFRTRVEERSRFEEPRAKLPSVPEEIKVRVPEPIKFRTDENVHKQKAEEHEQDWTVAKHSDSSEIRELRSRMKLVMNKLSIAKREKDQLAKENKSLQEEVMNLQSNLRQMIPGFSNTSSSFPMQAELTVKIVEFYKYDCLDLFFDLLCPELNMKGILFFFATAFSKLQAAINSYSQPAFTALQSVGCLSTLEGPIMSVLRKSFQAQFLKIGERIFHEEQMAAVVKELQDRVKLGGSSPEINQTLTNFLGKLGQLLFECSISDPLLHLEIAGMGKKVLFNPLKHDPFDGFIKPKEECWVVLPEIRKGGDSGELLSKALVLQTGYDIVN